MSSNGRIPKIKPGILLLPPGPNGEKWGIDDWAANREWGPEDFNSFIHPMHQVFDLEAGEFIAERNGLLCLSSSNPVSENDDDQYSDQLPALTVAEFLEKAPVSYDWVCEGIAAKGAVVKFAGKAKDAGKTTFLMCMSADIIAGTPYLNRATKKSRVLYLSEQANSLRVALEDAGLDDPNVDGLYLLPANLVVELDWKKLMDVVKAYCVAREIDLLVVDTLVDFSDVEDTSENDAGPVKRTIKPLKRLAGAHNVAVIFTQHHNVEGRGRGSTQFEGDPDILLDLYTPDQVNGDLDHNVRQLWARGRGVNYRQLVRFTQENGYEALNQADETLTTVSKKAKTVLRFLPVLEAEARSISELLKALKTAEKKMARSTVERALGELKREGLACEKGEGTKGDPARFWRQEPNQNDQETTDTNLSSSFSDTGSGDDDDHFSKPQEDDSPPDNVIPLRPKTSEAEEGNDKKKGKEKPKPLTPEELAKRFDSYVHTAERLAECHRWVAEQPYVAVDIETKGKNKDEATLYTKATVRGIALHANGPTWFLDCDHLEDEKVASLLRELETKPKYFHHSAFDVPRLHRRFEVLLTSNVHDTLVATRAARAGEWEEVQKTEKNGNLKTTRPKKSFELDACLWRELGIEVPKVKQKWSGPLTEAHLEYIQDDVTYLKELYEKLYRRIEELGVKTTYDTIAKTVHMFLEASASGIPFDAGMLESIQEVVARERDEFKSVLEELAPEHPDGGTWVWGNTNKPNAVDGYGNKTGRDGVLRMLEIVGVKLTNLEEQTLLDNMDKHPLVKALYDYRTAANKHSKYARILTDFYEDGRMFPQVKIAGAVTGRVLYSDPNIQGFDKKKTNRYRACVRAEEGHLIVKGDFAQQELRIAAYFSQDKDLLAAFESGEDVYIKVAEKIVGKPVKRGTEEGEKARAAAKRAVLGYLYGLGPAKYRRNAYKDTGVEISEEEAYRDCKAFREAYPGFYEWQKKYGSYKDETNLRKPDRWETRSVKGWRRVVAGQYEHKSEWKKENNVPADWIPKYTDRLNGPIQSTAGDVLYLTVDKLDADLSAGSYLGTKFLFTAHDEIVLTCPETIAKDVAAWLKSKMLEAFEEVLSPKLGGPKSVEVGGGPSWGEIEEWA